MQDEVLSKIENLLLSYYGVKEDVQEMLYVADTRVVPEGGSASVKKSTKQHNSGTCRGKFSSLEQTGSECKRMKVDTAIDGRAENVAVVITQSEKERLQNAAGTESLGNVLHEERDFYVDKSILENVVHDENLTDASEMTSRGWTATKNTFSDSNQYFDSRLVNRESVPETSHDEESGKNGVGLHLDYNEQSKVPSRMYEDGFDPPSGVVDFELTNRGDEAVHGMDRVKSYSCSVKVLNKEDSVSNVMQETHIYTANIHAKPVQSDLEDLNKGSDLSVYLNKQTEFSSSSSNNTVSVSQDRGPLNQNFGKSDADKQACSTASSVSDLTDATRVPLPAVDEDVWEAADLAMENWSKGQIKAPSGKVMQVKSCHLI